MQKLPPRSRLPFVQELIQRATRHIDVQRVLFNLHWRLLPTTALEEKADEYLAAGLISREMAKRVIECIKQERGTATYLNDGVSEVTDENADGNQSVDCRRLRCKLFLTNA